MFVKCPKCGHAFDGTEHSIPPVFNPNDPVQVEGYTDAENGRRGPHPYPDGSPKFYRYNRGLHHFWNGNRLKK